MTDKERLETIKFRLTFGSMNLCNAPRINNFESPFEIVHKEDLTWIIKQAERAQELEIYKRGLEIEENAHEKTKKVNKHYREALEFYADEENYVKGEFKALNPNAKSIMMSSVEWDDGEKARQSLRERSDG